MTHRGHLRACVSVVIQMRSTKLELEQTETAVIPERHELAGLLFFLF